MTIQQALTSGYLNSVITTIEKRYEIPSSISGIIASMYEIGNVVTVIFVSYLGSRRHIPIWIGMGKILFFSAKKSYIFLRLLSTYRVSSFKFGRYEKSLIASKDYFFYDFRD